MEYRFVSLVLVALATAGCLQDRYGEWAEGADESALSTQSEAGLLVASSEQMMSSATPEEAASASAARAGTFYQPAGCVTATASGTSVTYVLDHCTGPYGLVTVTGTVVVDYRLGAGGLEYTATANDLAVNSATVSFVHEGVLTIDGTTRTVDVDGHASGTGRRGRAFSREGHYTFSWDTATECLTLDGDWTTTSEAIAWTTAVRGYDRCGAGCPAAGASIEWRSGVGSLRIDYDGSDTATWTAEARREHTGTIDLLCAPAS